MPVLSTSCVIGIPDWKNSGVVPKNDDWVYLTQLRSLCPARSTMWPVNTLTRNLRVLCRRFLGRQYWIYFSHAKHTSEFSHHEKSQLHHTKSLQCRTLIRERKTCNHASHLKNPYTWKTTLLTVDLIYCTGYIPRFAHTRVTPFVTIAFLCILGGGGLRSDTVASLVHYTF